VEVRAAVVETRHIQREIEAVGTLFPYDEVIVSAEIEGRVEQVGADLGDLVKPGQVLASISDEEQRYLLQQNEAQLRQALEKLGLKGEKDKVGDIRKTPEVRRAQADLFEAEQRYKRMRGLVDQGIGSRQDLDQAQARFHALQANLDSTLNQTRNLIQDVERNKAVLDLQRKKLRDTTVKAPFAGAIKDRQVTTGQYVRPNTPLFTIVKIDPVRLRAEIPERMAPWVKVGQIADVAVEAFEGRKFQGKIWRISPTVDQTKRTFIVEALIPNGAGQLKPGSYAKARIKTDQSAEISLVPVRAVNYVLGSNKLYVVGAGGIETRDVKLGDRFDQQVEILEGAVKVGERVAVSQLAKLDSGTQVRVIEGRENGDDRTQK
jgi:RND family efflux transporter MFP subunit